MLKLAEHMGLGASLLSRREVNGTFKAQHTHTMRHHKWFLRRRRTRAMQHHVLRSAVGHVLAYV